MPPSEPLTDPAPMPPFPASDTAPPLPSSSPSFNGDEETALARLADDGGPPPPQTDAEATSEAKPSERESDREPSTPSLEQRVQRLEEVVALLQERPAVPARVTPEATAEPPRHRPPETKPVPLPAVPPPAKTAIRIDAGKLPALPVAVAVRAPAPVPPIIPAVHRGKLLWLLWETWAEARAIFRMFLDPRYQLPWSARTLPLVILAAILTSRFWVPFSSIPYLGDWLLVKIVDLLLAFLLFKWLGHEARRYRQTSPDLPANLRL